MDLNLASMYGTPGGQEAAEDQEKVAQAQLFSDLATENGIIETNRVVLGPAEIRNLGLWMRTYAPALWEKMKK